MTQHTDEGVLVSSVRLPNSFNGNPRYTLTLDNGNSYDTKADGFIGYQLQNYKYEGCTVRLLIERQNRNFVVWDISVI